MGGADFADGGAWFLARSSHAPRCALWTAGSDRYQFTALPRQGAMINMAEQTSNRKVLIAVDGSEHGDRAFDCKFVRIFRPSRENIFYLHSTQTRVCMFHEELQ